MTAIISQSDVVTAYGWGLDALWDGLMAGQTAIRPTDRFKERNFVSDQAAMVPDLRASATNPRVMAMLEPLLSKLVGRLDPKTPLILATTVGQIEFIERAILDGPLDLAADAAPSVLLGRIKNLLGLTGPAMVVSSACASSSAALSRAASIIQCGAAPAVLLVTCDAVSEFVYSGFSTLQSLCETPAKPFDRDRCGLSLGEAAAWALLTDGSAAPVDNDAVSVLGWASTSDAAHMTAPHRQALGLSCAIEKAMAMAGREASEIGVVAAHGTATEYSDAMELIAFRRAIQNPVPIFSVKGGTGHTLGAAGLIQILVSARALARGQAPPTVGLNLPTPDAQGWAHPTAVPIQAGSVGLSTNSGFGGVNTAIVLGRRAEARPPSTVPSAAHRRIRAVTWSLGDESNEAMIAIVGKPIKYLSRMTAETRCCLVAAAKAMKTPGLDSPAEIGILVGGEEGVLRADVEYFRDYVACGQSLGRGNLFIYTLPTSAASEMAIALGLRGPAFHIGADELPARALVEQAGQMLADGEAGMMLAMWSSPRAAVCIALDRQAQPGANLDELDWSLGPLPMARALAVSEARP